MKKEIKLQLTLVILIAYILIGACMLEKGKSSIDEATFATWLITVFKAEGTATTSTTQVGINYTQSSYIFTQNTAITTITPTTTGTITTCTANPSLTSGLSLNNTTCAISGTPTVRQISMSYTISATGVSSNASTQISIKSIFLPKYAYVTNSGGGNILAYN
jgi:Putative Ig domain